MRESQSLDRGQPCASDAGRSRRSSSTAALAASDPAATGYVLSRDDAYLFSLLHSSHPRMKRAIAVALRVAPFDISVLLVGESGTGKRVLAAAIHAWSRRRSGPFVTVACSGAPPPRGEPEHHQVATHGTLFLSEVGMLPSAAQAKVIRLVDDDHVGDAGATDPAFGRARVIASTSRDLEWDVRTGRFRHDLFMRLNTISIHLPPLRERAGDLARLTAEILTAVCARRRRRPVRPAPEVSDALVTYRWPGNVAELASVLEHAVTQADGNALHLEHLPDRLRACRA